MNNLKILIVVSLLTGYKGICQNSAIKDFDSCQNKKVKLLVENRFRKVYFFFRETNFQKNTRIDKIVGENGNVIRKSIMKSTNDHDQYSYKTFRRLVIKDNQIHEVIIKQNKTLGKLIIYDFCGQVIKEELVSVEKLYEQYDFNQNF